MRAISNRLLLSAASIPPAVPSGISSFFFFYCGCVCVCVWADVLVFRSRDELARNREYDGDDDYYCCCCFGCCGGFVSTTPSPLLLPSLLLLVLRDATGMMGRVAATTRSIPEECRRLRRMRERGGSRHSCDNEREHHRREKFLSWLR